MSFCWIFILLKLGTQNYKVEVLAGNGKAATIDGIAEECSFNDVYGITVHEAAHSLFVTEAKGNIVRKVSFVY